MSPSDLKYEVEQAGHEPYFFDRKTMKFFGDTMRNYGVCSSTVRTQYNEAGDYVGANGVELEVWELYRRRAVKHGLQSSTYFCKKTFKRVFTERETHGA